MPGTSTDRLPWPSPGLGARQRRRSFWSGPGQRFSRGSREGAGMYPELSGKTALVTGAARGFGRAIALRLAREGARVGVNYRRSRSDAAGVVAEIEAVGGQALALKGDVGSDESLDRMFEDLVASLGSLDILVANAAFGVPGRLLAATPRHWQATLDASARSLLSLAQRSVPLMSGGWGRVISISSEGGQKVIPGYGVVGVAKSALEAVTRALAVELAPRGIVVNGVMPGLADTRSFRAIPGADEALAEARARTPSGRVVVPEDVANVVAFLASDQASMICGQFIVVDGGRMVH